MVQSWADIWYRLAEATTKPELAKVYFQNALETDSNHVRRTMITKIIPTIAPMTIKREYGPLRTAIEWLVRYQGWLETLDLFRSMLKETPNDVRPVRGKIRDALFHILDLTCVAGLDAEPLEEFSVIFSQDLSEVRGYALDVASQLLERQVKHRNTFFLDIDELTTTPLVKHLPSILNARRREVLELPSDPTLGMVVGTCYGFNTFVSAGHDSETQIDAVSGARKAFEELAASMGHELNVRGKKLPFKASNWPHVSENMQQILLNTMRMSLTRSTMTRKSAAKMLGLFGDLRMREILKDCAPTIKDRYVRRALQKALGVIGRPSEDHEEIGVFQSRSGISLKVLDELRVGKNGH